MHSAADEFNNQRKFLMKEDKTPSKSADRKLNMRIYQQDKLNDYADTTDDFTKQYELANQHLKKTINFSTNSIATPQNQNSIYHVFINGGDKEVPSYEVPENSPRDKSLYKKK